MGKVNLREGNVSLILDSYNDLFSDFDPRPYSDRALSEDFLLECRRAAREKDSEKIELRLLVPRKFRKKPDELMIKRRLKEHFYKNFVIQKKGIKKIWVEGLFWVFLGTIIMIVATFAYRFSSDSFLIDLFFIISEPAGWFAFWEGLGKMFIESKKGFPDYEFYLRMNKLDVSFLSY